MQRAHRTFTTTRNPDAPEIVPPSRVPDTVLPAIAFTVVGAAIRATPVTGRRPAMPTKKAIMAQLLKGVS